MILCNWVDLKSPVSYLTCKLLHSSCINYIHIILYLWCFCLSALPRSTSEIYITTLYPVLAMRYFTKDGANILSICFFKGRHTNLPDIFGILFYFFIESNNCFFVYDKSIVSSHFWIFYFFIIFFNLLCVFSCANLLFEIVVSVSVP